MGDGILAGIFFGICGVLVGLGFMFVVFLGLSKLDEWECEYQNNVYSCVQDDTWHPVFEEGPEEELMP